MNECFMPHFISGSTRHRPEPTPETTMEEAPQSPDAWRVVMPKSPPNKKFKSKHPKKMPAADSPRRRAKKEEMVDSINTVMDTLGAASRSPLCTEEGREEAWKAGAGMCFIAIENPLGPGTDYVFDNVRQCVANSYEQLGPLCAKLRRAAAERWEKLAFNRVLRDTCIRYLPEDVQRDFAVAVIFVREGLKPIPPPPPRPRACRS